MCNGSRRARGARDDGRGRRRQRRRLWHPERNPRFRTRRHPGRPGSRLWHPRRGRGGFGRRAPGRRRRRVRDVRRHASRPSRPAARVGDPERRARGFLAATTTSLQASKLGQSIYARLGYRPLGEIHLYEKRPAHDAQPRAGRGQVLPPLRTTSAVAYPRSITCPHCGYGAYYNPKPVAAAIPTTPDNRIILLRRGFEPGKDLWTFPGGFVDLGETVEQAARREAREEIEADVELTSS